MAHNGNNIPIHPIGNPFSRLASSLIGLPSLPQSSSGSPGNRPAACLPQRWVNCTMCEHISEIGWTESWPEELRQQRSDLAATARATLKDLLLESEPFARIDSFYPPRPSLSPSAAAAVHAQLLYAFRAAATRTAQLRGGGGGGGGGSSSGGRSGRFKIASASASWLAKKAPRRSSWSSSLPLMPASHSSQPPPFSTFTRFPDLPTELRLAIWRMALDNRPPRTLHVGHRLDTPSCWTSRLPMPVLARVCREARSVAMPDFFPVHGVAPYRTGPSASQDTMMTFVSSWVRAGPTGDVLDLGNVASPSQLGCLDVVPAGLAEKFAAVAVGYSGLLVDFADRTRLGNAVAGALDPWVATAKTVLVVVQTIYIPLPIEPPSGSDLGGLLRSTAKSVPYSVELRKYLDALPMIGPRFPVGLDDVMPPRLEDQFVSTESHWTSLIRRQNTEHLTVVVALSDRARIRELLDLGSAIGLWDSPQSRMQAVGHMNKAFCLDCLQKWWDKYGLPSTKERLRRARENVAGGADDEIPALPEMMPAVRFKVQWPEGERRIRVPSDSNVG